jgi:phosphoribosylaminoimidazole-succinocarboxamide synthase
VRNYLDTVVESGAWGKTPPGPELPEAVIEQSIARYLEAYTRLTGEKLAL